MTSPGVLIMAACVLQGWTLLGCGVDPAGGESCAEACARVECVGGSVCDCGECVPGPDAGVGADAGCRDDDGDGFGEGCAAGPDCDDTRAEVSPAATEVCDELDNNCDFQIDEGGVCIPCPDVPICELGALACTGESVLPCVEDARGCASFGEAEPCPDGLSCRDGACVETCADLDNDGFFADCPTSELPDDCDDENGAINPGAVEICDGEDNDCNRRIDDGGVCDVACEDECTLGDVICSSDSTAQVPCQRAPNGCTRWGGAIPCSTGACQNGTCVDAIVCIDLDRDRFGPGCEAGDDCRPLDTAANSDAEETCNGVDDDCDGQVDEGVTCPACDDDRTTRDGVGVGQTTYVSCGTDDHPVFGPPSLLGAVASVQGSLRDVAFGSLPWRERQPFAGDAVSAYAGPWDAPQDPALSVRADAGQPVLVVLQSATTECGDPYEPNNAPAAGTYLGDPPVGVAADLCPSDVDFYRVNVREGDVLRAVWAADSPRLGVNATWWNNGRQVSWPFVDAAEGGGTTHTRAVFPGEYVVAVRSPNPTAEAGYALAIVAEPAGACDPDVNDRGGRENETPASATRLIDDTANATICPGDTDVYDLGSFDGDETLSIAWDDRTEGELGFVLLLGGYGALRTDAFFSNPGDGFDIGINDPGRYYLLVAGRDARTSGDYTLGVRR